jgi:putative ABC transport system permease protein
MAHSAGTVQQQNDQKTPDKRPARGNRAIIPPTITLAAWRLRQTWRLLLLTGLGMVAAVVLVCVAPLFSQVSLTAGLRSALTATPQDRNLVLHSSAKELSVESADATNQEFDNLMHQHVGKYLDGPPQFSIQMQPLDVNQFNPGDQITLIGESTQAAAPHARLVAGRLPQPNSDVLEVAITPAMAAAFNDPLGAQWTATLGFLGTTSPTEVTLQMRVVGIFFPLPGDQFWHDETFDPAEEAHFVIFKGLMSNDGLLTELAHLKVNGLPFLDKPNLLWYYSLNAPQTRMADLDDLITQLNTVQLLLAQQFADTIFLSGTELIGPSVEAFGLPSVLEKYRDRVAVVQIPVNIVALQLFCLMVFFVSMMANLLVDRQAEVIALLRSRGASRWQVFGSFVNQSVGLGLIALVAGPLLALLTTRLLTQILLTPADQQALNIISDPVQGALDVGWYALAASLGAVVAMIITIRSSASRDVLEMRRESARALRRPLWQRLYLDMIAAVIALTGFGLSLYVTHAGVFDTRVDLFISAPLALVAPIFLVIAGVLLFLRFFPVLLRRASRLAARYSGAAPVLALAQMARQPRQAMRMVLLLALASSFAVFTQVFTASEAQQINSVAANQVGADFSGIPVTAAVPDPATVSLTLNQQTAAYRQIPGVLSATLGYAGSSVPIGGATTIPIAIRGVDTQTFAQTALWTDQDSSQSLPSLMNQLVHARRVDGIPAIVDALAWNELHLTAGEMFTLAVENGTLSFIPIAEVQHIPTVNDSLSVPGTSDYTPPGGILVDYQALFNFYHTSTGNLLSLNYAWLHTSDSPALLTKIRAALNKGPLAWSLLNDRRAMLADLQHDPLYLNLVGMLTLGALATVLLALVGNLIASWLNARSRLINFVVLRALGSAPGQIARVLIWEQGIIYATAIGLGIVFGAILVLSVVPALVFVGAPGNGAAISSGEFYTIQHVLPVQIVLPASLWLIVAALVVISAAALWMMARVVSKPSLSQTLRLSED